MSATQTPKGWRLVNFGDVVRNVNDNTRAPEAEGIERVVGLEHIDSESLPLRRWNDLSALPDGTTFTRRFKPGQVLFGKRRAYQRKVAVPDFAGICSGDILVLEPANDSILAEFLPYVVQSDGFFDHALGTSAGSLSPRTKWADLAKYGFALPSVEEQRQIAALLGSTAVVAERTSAAISAVSQVLTSLIVASYEHWSEHGRMRPVPELGQLTMGRQKAPKYELGVNPVPYLRVADVAHLELDAKNLPVMDFSDSEVAKYKLEPGDVLITEGDIVSAMNVGRACVYEDGPEICCFQNTLIRLRPASHIDAYFAMAMIEGARLKGVLAAAAGTTTVSHLGLKKLSSVLVPVAPSDPQHVLADRIRTLLAFRTRLRTHLQQVGLFASSVRSEVGL